MELTLPNSIDNIEMESFARFTASLAQDFIKVTTLGTNTVLTFKNHDVIVSNGGNWFDLGISFKAYIAPESTPPAGTNALDFLTDLNANTMKENATSTACLFQDLQSIGKIIGAVKILNAEQGKHAKILSALQGHPAQGYKDILCLVFFKMESAVCFR